MLKQFQLFLCILLLSTQNAFAEWKPSGTEVALIIVAVVLLYAALIIALTVFLYKAHKVLGILFFIMTCVVTVLLVVA